MTLGFVLLLVGGIVALTGLIWGLVIAFRQSAAWGWCCLLVPFAFVVFAIKHWPAARTAFLIWSAGVGLLAIGLVPAIGVAQAMAQETVCLANVRQLCKAVNQYAYDNNAWLPSNMRQLNPYISDRRDAPLVSTPWVCPCEADRTKPSYSIATSKNLRDIERPERTVVIIEVCANHGGKRAAGFVDGHAELLDNGTK